MQTPVRAACDEGIYLSIYPPSIYLSNYLSIHCVPLSVLWIPAIELCSSVWLQ